MALSDGSSDEDPVGSTRVAVNRVDVPANVDELTSKLKILTCSITPATKIKVAEIGPMGPIGTLIDESGTTKMTTLSQILEKTFFSKIFAGPENLRKLTSWATAR